MKNKKVLKGYMKERESQLLQYIQASPHRAVNKRAIAKINALLSDEGFKKSVLRIRQKPNFFEPTQEMHDMVDKEVYSLMREYGYTRDWFNTFSSIVRDNTFSAIIEGETIHIQDINDVDDFQLTDFKAVNPIAIFIKPDTSLEEIREFVSGSWVKIQNLQNKYKTSKSKPSVKSAEVLDIENIILQNQEKTSAQIAGIISAKYPQKSKKGAEVKYGINYVEKVKTKLRKNMLNQ